jgi:long-chain acyl-CoA synthetase
VGQKDSHLSHLPLAHIYERVGGLMSMLYNGCKICYGTGIDNLSYEIIEVRPTILITVPRLFEKIYAGMMAHIQENSKLNRRMVEWAMDLGETCLDYEQADMRVPAHLTVQRRLADRLVYSKIRDRFGGMLRMAVSSSAPIANEILRFLSIIGLEVIEVWGMTETTGPITSNRIGFQKIGSVGPPIPGTKIKLNSDGEVMVRGPQVMQGYYRDEKASAEVMSGGWLATGDIGEIDKEGFLSITDRKKDIIITAGGKNVAPQNLEVHFKLEPLFSEFLIFGDRRKFLVALITLDEQKLVAWAKKEKISYADFADLTKKPEVREIVESIIREKNKAMPNYETVKRFAVLDHQFTREGEELTPTMKVMRRNVAKIYSDLIDSLYTGLKDGKY